MELDAFGCFLCDLFFDDGYLLYEDALFAVQVRLGSSRGATEFRISFQTVL